MGHFLHDCAQLYGIIKDYWISNLVGVLFNVCSFYRYKKKKKKKKKKKSTKTKQNKNKQINKLKTVLVLPSQISRRDDILPSWPPGRFE